MRRRPTRISDRLTWILAVSVAMLTPAPPARAQATPAPDASGLRTEIQTGVWRVAIETPGGPLPFTLVLGRDTDAGTLEAWVVNGGHRERVQSVERVGDGLRLSFGAYDAELFLPVGPWGTGAFAGEPGRFEYSRPGREFALAVRAEAGDPQRFRSVATGTGHGSRGTGHGALSPRYLIRFGDSENGAVGEFELHDDGVTVTGTILTATGDYGHLGGRYEHTDAGGRLRLSTFNGGHAFLFDATADAEGTLRGTFWSGAHYRADWTGTPLDADREILPDAWGSSRWVFTGDLADLVYPTPDGGTLSLGDPEYNGRVRVLELFGSWCPNCHDAAALMGELDETYRARGLSVIGLAFERETDPDRRRELVGAYIERHGIGFEVAIAGLSDKAKASESLPVLDRVRAYPTTIFIDKRGRVRAVHTGYTGPATGDRYAELRVAFASLIEDLLAE